ncbi:MAG: BON domain-containing protein [Anaerolineae bacterium]
MPANVVPVNGNNPKDRELEGQVREALVRYATLRIWGHALQIQAHDGVITLAGHVRTVTGKETAERLVGQVAGVRDIVNELIVDTQLEMTVARALGDNPVTGAAFPGILVGSGFGEIFLKGSVASVEIKQVAAQVAAGVPGVLRVVNELAAPVPPAPVTPSTEEAGRAE